MTRDIPKYRTRENCCGCFIWFWRGRTWWWKEVVKGKVEGDVTPCEGAGSPQAQTSFSWRPWGQEGASPPATSPFTSLHALYCQDCPPPPSGPNSESSLSLQSLAWCTRHLGPWGWVLTFPSTRRRSYSHFPKILLFAHVGQWLASLKSTGDPSLKAHISLTIPTPSNVKTAVPKNSRKFSQLAIKGRLPGSGISWKEGEEGHWLCHGTKIIAW